MKADPLKYPVGIQSFAELRQGGYVYVDKTAYVADLVGRGKCYFLSRPRRFGKSLLLSTLQAYFEGRKELFEGLAISKSQNEWPELPVLRFDLSVASCNKKGELVEQLQHLIDERAQEFGVTLPASLKVPGHRFGELIKQVARATGKKVVVLVDEYDKPLISALSCPELIKDHEDVLEPFFSQIKALDDQIAFAFITGVSRFRHITLFSGFNNPDDISLDPAYASICGITDKEMRQYLAPGIAALSQKYGEEEEEMAQRLKEKYDGYRFTLSQEWVYNPFSLISALKSQRLGNFWITTALNSTLLLHLKNSPFRLSDLADTWYADTRLCDIYREGDNLAPLLFQTGYLTVADYRPNETYKLRIPNNEVRQTLIEILVPFYTGNDDGNTRTWLWDLKEYAQEGEAEKMLEILQSIFKSIPGHIIDHCNMEKHYHTIVYLMFMMLGLDTQSEISIAGGRIDMVAKTDKYIYIFEFKLDGDAEDALNQIDSKGYVIPWRADGREVVKIGAVFSSEMQTLSKWKIE